MAVDIRKGMPSTHLERAEFEKRFREQFFDPAFAKVEAEIAKIAEIAWQSYDGYNKNPRKQRAGEGFADPDFELPVEWLAARAAIEAAAKRHADPKSPSRILIVNGSTRSDQTCPGEMSKTWRLVQMCRALVEEQQGFEAEVLDLSLLASEAQKAIYPCKACLSTAQPLCHWPCTCYPNFALGQVNDWMAEIYPKWVAAHGVMIVTPVNWYQAPSSLKLMIDRLVCADGGNPDPTTTRMKSVAPAKELELKGWPYPRHLAGRAFFGRCAWRRGRRREPAPHPVRLVAGYRHDRLRAQIAIRRVYRLSRTLCNEPQGSRRRYGFSGGREKLGACADRGRQIAAQGRTETARCFPDGVPSEMISACWRASAARTRETPAASFRSVS